MEDTISVELSVEDWNKVLAVLQGGVYNMVAPLMAKITVQFQAHNQRVQQLRLGQFNGLEVPDGNEPKQVSD